MYIVYTSKKKIIYSVVAIVLILLICVFTIAGMPKEEDDISKADGRGVAKNTDLSNIIDNNFWNTDGENEEPDNPENVDGGMESEDDESIEDTTNTEDTNTSENVSVKKTASSTKSNTDTNTKTTSSTKSNTDTNTKTTSSETEKSEIGTSSEESTQNRNHCASNNTKSDGQTFSPKVYSLDNVKAKYVTFKLSGTKNAHTDGIYKFLDNDTGNYVENRWSTALNSAGIGYVTMSFPPSAVDPQFHIKWAGVWNEDGTVAVVAECSMVCYDSN